MNLTCQVNLRVENVSWMLLLACWVRIVDLIALALLVAGDHIEDSWGVFELFFILVGGTLGKLNNLGV